jgi:hypothetical protein
MGIVIDQDTEWVTLNELHHRINKNYRVSIRTLRRWAEHGTIPAKRRGSRQWFVNIAELRDMYAGSKRHQAMNDASASGMMMFVDPEIADTVDTCDNWACENPDCRGECRH